MLLAGNLILELPILLFCASNANSSKRLFQLSPCNRFGGRRIKSNNIFLFSFFIFRFLRGSNKKKNRKIMKTHVNRDISFYVAGLRIQVT